MIPRFERPAIVCPAIVCLVLLASGAAALAQQVERCSGTFCDLYYGGSKETPAASPASSAPTPLTVPSAGNVFTNMFSSSPASGASAAAPATERSSFFNVGGGGVVGSKRDTECGGTLCDLMHGHSNTPESDVSLTQSMSGTPSSQLSREATYRPETAVTAAPIAPAEGASAPASSAEAAPQRRVAERAPPKPSCVARAGDPWGCYRR